MNIKFTKVFNVEVERETYKSFIEGLRSELKLESSRKILISPPELVFPPEWFEIVLRTNAHEIRLMIRTSSLYLDGYRMENSETWLEFGGNPQSFPSTTHLIPGSSFLDFHSFFDSLECACKKGRYGVCLGRDQLRDAVNHLAISAKSREERARSLLVVLLMICESIKFEDYFDFLFDFYIVGRGSCDDSVLLQELYIREARVKKNKLPCISFSPNIPIKGGPMVQVFTVRINEIQDKDSVDLYGTITITDEFGCEYIYNRKREDAESIKRFEWVSLNGPSSRSIQAFDPFPIYVDLMERDSLCPISRGCIYWDGLRDGALYDQPLFKTVDGENGSATVIFAVFRKAVQATVEVTLIKGNGEVSSNVYGYLAAINDKFGPRYETLLFLIQEDSGKSVEVNRGMPIPLLRSVVAVPWKSRLKVLADLYDRDSIQYLSSEYEIANGSANFPAQLSGTSKQCIYGQYGKIEVKVTWRNVQ